MAVSDNTQNNVMRAYKCTIELLDKNQKIQHSDLANKINEEGINVGVDKKNLQHYIQNARVILSFRNYCNNHPEYQYSDEDFEILMQNHNLQVCAADIECIDENCEEYGQIIEFVMTNFKEKSRDELKNAVLKKIKEIEKQNKKVVKAEKKGFLHRQIQLNEATNFLYNEKKCKYVLTEMRVIYFRKQYIIFDVIGWTPEGKFIGVDVKRTKTDYNTLMKQLKNPELKKWQLYKKYCSEFYVYTDNKKVFNEWEKEFHKDNNKTDADIGMVYDGKVIESTKENEKNNNKVLYSFQTKLLEELVATAFGDKENTPNSFIEKLAEKFCEEKKKFEDDTKKKTDKT